MLDETANFAAALNHTKPHWLLLCGTTGTGKSHLAHKVWKQFMRENRFDVKFDPLRNRIVGNTAIWIDWRKWCRDLRSSYSYEAIDDVINEWFVVIDDVGASRDNTGFVTDALEQIIAGREGKWTMMTSNLTLRDMARDLDVRIADRMLRNRGVIVEVNAQSYVMRGAAAA